MAMIEIGEWTPDRAKGELRGARRAENVVPTADGYNSMEGLESTPNSVPDVVRGAGRGTLKGDNWLGAGTETQVFLSDGTGFNDRTGAAITALAPDERWIFHQFESTAFQASILVSLGKQNEPRRTTNLASSFTALDAGSGISNANVSCVFSDFYILGDIVNTQNPTTGGGLGDIPDAIHWSAINDPSDWPELGSTDARNKQSDVQIFPEGAGRVTALVAAAEYFLVFREREVWRADYVGGDNVFAFRLLDASRGCIVTDGAISVGPLTYFPSEAGWYACNGATITPIGLERVDRFWRAVVGDLVLASNRGSKAYDAERKIIWWNFPNASLTLGYHTEIDRWTSLTENLEWIVTATAGNQETLDTLPTYGSLNMDDTVSGLGSTNLDTLGGASLDEQLIGVDVNHEFKTFTSVTSPLTGIVGGGDYLDPGEDEQRLQLRWVRPRAGTASAGSITMFVESRNNPLDDLTLGPTKTLNSIGVIPYRRSARYMRPTFTLQNGFVRQFRGFEPSFTLRGRR